MANTWYNQGMSLDSTDFTVTKLCQITRKTILNHKKT